MNSLVQRLQGHFNIVNLGAGGDADYKAPPGILAAATVLELDAGDQRMLTTERYLRKIRIKEFVSDTGGVRTFYKRTFWGCSGLVPALQEVVSKYGLEQFFALQETSQVLTRSLGEILSEHALDKVDFLKTDLEGLDFRVIKSVEHLLPDVLAVQCELRYDPVFEGEAPCEETTLYLRKLGFEVIGLKPEYWKPRHPDWTRIADGNIAWADFLLFRSAASTVGLANARGDTLVLHKQILLAAMLGKLNHACHLCYKYWPLMGQHEAAEIAAIMPQFAAANHALSGQAFAPAYPHVADPKLSVSS